MGGHIINKINSEIFDHWAVETENYSTQAGTATSEVPSLSLSTASIPCCTSQDGLKQKKEGCNAGVEAAMY